MSSYEEYQTDTTDMGNYPLSFIRDIIENEPVDVPFDVTMQQTDNPYLFGLLGQSHRIGRWVRFHGGAVVLDTGETETAPLAYGKIVGDLFGRVVISFEGSYIGWVSPDMYEVLHISDDASDEVAGIAH